MRTELFRIYSDLNREWRVHMLTTCSRFVLALLLALVSSSAFAQAQIEPSIRSTLFDLTGGIAALPAGEAITLATALEVANAPVGSSAGGFVFKLDPATGLRVRTAPTFGPSFAERALTAGEGKVSFGASFGVATYDKLNELSLEQMRLAASNGPLPSARETGFASLVLSSETVVLSTSVGATDNLDIFAAVPFVKVKLDGISWIENVSGSVIGFNRGKISSSGLGDLAVGAKYRVLRFGEGPPDPGGVALMLTTRLPTGNRENLRGLGITRVLGSVLASAGKGRFRPHGNAGFEWWEKGLEVATDYSRVNRVEARHQLQYAAGFEFEAGPKVTLLTDVVARHIWGDGSVSVENVTVPPFLTGVTSLELAVATKEGVRKLAIAPGLKWNLKGTFVFSWNAIIPIRDNGLHDMFTPVIGLDWTF
jgi:Putative MetA-pathway of phenol degradation